MLPRACEIHKLIMTCSLSHFIVVSMVAWWLFLLLFRQPVSFCSSDDPVFNFPGTTLSGNVLRGIVVYFFHSVLDEMDFPEFLLLVGRGTFVTLYCTFLWGKLINSNLNSGILCELTLYLQYKTNTFLVCVNYHDFCVV